MTAAPVRTEATLRARDLGFSHGGVEILRSVTIAPLAAGTVTSVVGPNGAGKSTLLRCLAGLERCTGEVEAPAAVYLPQEPPAPSALTVYESVLACYQVRRGGTAGLRVASCARSEVAQTIARLGLAPLAGKPLAHLSGGERQLAGFAQAVVQQPRVLLLDEPTSALDVRNQLLLMQQVRDYAREARAVVVMTVHDLPLAARFGDQVVVLSEGRVHAQGAAREVITPDMLREVYRISALVEPSGERGVSIDAHGAL